MHGLGVTGEQYEGNRNNDERAEERFYGFSLQDFRRREWWLRDGPKLSHRRAGALELSKQVPKGTGRSIGAVQVGAGAARF
jgi:hypothetical protein